MKKGYTIGLVLWAILLLIVILLRDKVKFPPNFESVFAIGVLWILVLTRFRYRFESKKIYLFMYLGLIFPFLIYLMIFIILENYPESAIFVGATSVLFALLAVIFTGLAAYKMSKELFDKFKR